MIDSSEFMMLRDNDMEGKDVFVLRVYIGTMTKKESGMWGLSFFAPRFKDTIMDLALAHPFKDKYYATPTHLRCALVKSMNCIFNKPENKENK